MVKTIWETRKTYRQAIFYQNKQIIEEHNQRTDITQQMGENQFTAITNEEFINLYLNTRSPQTLNDQNLIFRKVNPKSSEPYIEQKINDGVDWRGWVTVRNQGNCASSYAIVISSAMEAEYEIIRQCIKYSQFNKLWIVLFYSKGVMKIIQIIQCLKQLVIFNQMDYILKINIIYWCGWNLFSICSSILDDHSFMEHTK